MPTDDQWTMRFRIAARILLGHGYFTDPDDAFEVWKTHGWFKAFAPRVRGLALSETQVGILEGLMTVAESSEGTLANSIS